MKPTPKFTIGNLDFFKGALLAAGIVIYKGIQVCINAGHLPDMTTLQGLIQTGLEVGGLYLFKQYFTTSDGTLNGIEPLTLPAAKTQTAAPASPAVAAAV